MGKSMRISVLAFFTGILLPLTVSAANLTADQAPSHVGENATICGTVASANYAAHAKGQPTFLNLDASRCPTGIRAGAKYVMPTML